MNTLNRSASVQLIFQSMLFLLLARQLNSCVVVVFEFLSKMSDGSLVDVMQTLTNRVLSLTRFGTRWFKT